MPDLKSELAKLAHAWDTHEQTIRTPNQTQPKQENNVTSINTTSITTTTTPAPVVRPPGKAGSPIRNNVMRTCFDTVWQHPGKTVKELSALLAAQGFKETSTTAVFAQLVRTGQAIKSDDGTITPNPAVKAYRPITLPTTRSILRKSAAAVRKAQKKAQKKGTTPPQSAGIAALKGDTAPAVAAVPAATTATVTVAPETKGVSSIIIHRNWTPESVLDKLTLPQAKQLYAALKEYFA